MIFTTRPKITPWLFASKRHDTFGRRYYNPQFGRWFTCDPQGFTDGPNLYAYVHNNPLTHFDEYGLFEGYWDPTPEESGMYDPGAQFQGMKNAAVSSFTTVRDIFFGCTYELGASIHSEFWGDPNDPNRVTPISQRSWTDIGLLAGGTALELSPAKVIGLGGRAVKWIGKGAVRALYARKVARVGERFFKNANKAVNSVKATPKKALNTFDQAASQLTKEGKDNIRVLRRWAESKGWEKFPNPTGKPEKWGRWIDGEFKWNLKIKPESSLRAGLEPQSCMPRFAARYGKGNYVNPFNGQTGNTKIGAHIPLEKSYW